MNAAELVEKGYLVYQCSGSKLKFWDFNGWIWATFHDTRWNFLSDVAVKWCRDRNIDSLIETQKAIYKFKKR